MPTINEDAQDILIAGISIANALSDGIQLSDVTALIKLPAAISGWSVGIDNLNELIGTSEGRQEITNFVAENFDIPDDELEDKIEKSINWLAATYGLYETWSD